MLVSAAVPALAFGFGRGEARGNIPDEVRDQITACRDLETKEEARDCNHEVMSTYMEENGIEPGEGCMGGAGMKRRPNMRNMPEEVQADLDACRESSDDTEVVRDCVHNVMTTYKEDNGIEGFKTGHGQGFGQGARFEKGEGFEQGEGFGFGRRGGMGRNMPEEVRESMRACHEDNPEDREAAHDCVMEIMEEFRVSE